MGDSYLGVYRDIWGLVLRNLISVTMLGTPYSIIYYKY